MRRFIPWFVFLSVAAAGLVAAGFAWNAGEAARLQRFEAMADDGLNRIQSRLDQHLALLNAAQGFIAASAGDPGPKAFARFVGALDLRNRHAGIRALGYAPLIAAGASGTAEGASSPDPGAWRTPVTLLEPLDDRNRAAVGFDMYSDARRRAAMQAAWEADAPRATGLLELRQSAGASPSPGFLVYRAIPQETDAETTASIGAKDRPRGFIYASFRTVDLFTAALAGMPPLQLAVTVRDTTASDAQQILFRSDALNGKEADPLETRRALSVAGRQWLLSFVSTTPTGQASRAAVPAALAILAVLLAATLALLARGRERHYDTMLTLHGATEKSLVEKDLMLQEMKHRIKNSIAKVLAIARQTAHGANSVEEFSASFQARLQAMATSQDMLTRSHWQKADLGELLRAELEQVFGKSPTLAVEGPSLALDERTTQALGLTFHELATNALKYGGRPDAGPALSVKWRIDRQGGKDRLDLIWREQGHAVEKPTKAGFGTRLIDMNIVRELNGRVERDYSEAGLTIAISIPLSP